MFLPFQKQLNIDFLIGKAPKDAKKSEEIARELRYDFFNEISKKYNSVEEGVFDIMKIDNVENSINELKKLSENYEDNTTALGIKNFIKELKFLLTRFIKMF